MADMKVKLLQRQIDKTISYIKPFLPLANCHMVGFITQDYWKHYVPSEIVKEVHENGTEPALETFGSVVRNMLIQNSKGDIGNSPIKQALLTGKATGFNALVQFIENANNYSLKVDGILCLTVEQFKEKFKHIGAKEVDTWRIDEFMSNKKSHEVEVLSSIVAMLSSCAQVDYTVELGGGRGFLATTLTTLYNMPVLNIDCAEGNQQGAVKRNKKMQKKWPGLIKKAEESKFIMNEKNFTNKPDDFKNMAEITCDLGKLSVEPDVSKRTNELYRHVTEFVTTETDLMKHVKYSYADSKSDVNLCLTGLHTCGDLGSTTLKLFKNNPSCSVVCAVPCCFHLLTEETLISESQNTSPGFPMSEYLKGFKIGCNARTLASQSVERFFDTQQLPPISLYYRALLEVLLKKYDIKISSTSKLKGFSHKCSNFSQYFRIAEKKLKLEAHIMHLTDEDIDSFESDYSQHKEELYIFYLLKMCLAPVIESVILLDRLMYLSENEFDGGIGDAYIVKIFDPVVSPRCNALVGYRKQYILK